MLISNEEYGNLVAAQPTITGGLGSGAGQNNPGSYQPYDYGTGDADMGYGGQNGGYGGGATYGPTQPARQYAPSADTTGQYYSDDGGQTWQWENFAPTGDADMGVGGLSPNFWEDGSIDWSGFPTPTGNVGTQYQVEPWMPTEQPFAEWGAPYQGQPSMGDFSPPDSFDATIAPYDDFMWGMRRTRDGLPYRGGWGADEYEGTPGGFPGIDAQWDAWQRGVQFDQFGLPTFGQSVPGGSQLTGYNGPDFIDHRDWSDIQSDPELDLWRNNPSARAYGPPLPPPPGAEPGDADRGYSGLDAAGLIDYADLIFGELYTPTGDADMGIGGSVANVPGYGYGDPEVAQWQGNPTFQQPSQYDVPWEEQTLQNPFPNANGGMFGGLGKAVDFATFPSDYIDELAIDMFNPGGMQGVASGGRRSSGPLAEDLEDPREAVSDFRNRPWYEQLAIGLPVDPLNVIGAGYADEIVDVARQAPDIARGAARGLDALDTGMARQWYRGLDEVSPGMWDAGVGEPLTAESGMVFRTGQKPGSNAGVIADSRAALTPEEIARVRGFDPNDTGGYEAYKAAREAHGPEPLANERLWFHSTNDTSFDLPDPDLAVGQSTGITQGPGIYMAADPAKSAGRYGPRTFVSEFDGNTLDLTKTVGPRDPVFPDGGTWAQFYADVAARLDELEMPVAAHNVRLLSLDAIADDTASVRMASPRAEVAEVVDGMPSNYHYKQAAIDAMLPRRGDTSEADRLWGWTQRMPDGTTKSVTTKDTLGRFAAVATDNEQVMTEAFIQNQLADHGIDALFHHSPRADGDVLIVLNGEKARVVADARNAADALTRAKSLGELKLLSGQIGPDNLIIKQFPEADAFTIQLKTGEEVGRGIGRGGKWYAKPYGLSQPEKTFATKADAEKWLRDLVTEQGRDVRDIKWYDNEAGGGRLPDLSGVGRALAPTVIQGGVGAGVGAAVGGYSSGDWEGALKGAAIGAAAGAGAGTAARGANALGSRGVAARAGTPAATISGAPKEATIKLAALIKAAKPARAETEALKHAELSRRVARAQGIASSGSDPRAALQRSKSALGGELPVAKFEPPEPSFTQDELMSMFQHVRGSNLQYFQKLNTADALTKVMAGQIPTRGEITLLENAFGKDLAKAILGKRALGTKAWEATVDALNLPRTIVTAWDASAPLRQGILLAAGRPKQFAGALGPMVRAMTSPKFAGHVDDAIRNSPNAGLYERANLYIAPSDVSGALTGREEAFMSRLASKIPGVAGSERGYTTFLNKLRTDVFDSIVNKWDDAAKTDANLKRLGDWLNVATGRGAGFSGKPGELLTATFFSPRYVASRFQAIGKGGESVGGFVADAARGKNPLADPINKEVIRDLAAFVLTGTSVLALAKLSGASVELDPRSSDFGKMRVGPTRYDFWGGEQQIARLVAQLATNQRKTTSTGEIVGLNRWETIDRFVRSKLSPQAGFARDVLSGEDYIGEDVDFGKSGVRDQAFQRFVPLFIQDITEAVMEDGWQAGIKALPSGAGVSTQTYLSTREVADQIAQRMFPGKSFVELNSGQQRQVKADPEYKEWISQYKTETPAVRDQVTIALTNYSNRKTELEGRLKGQIDAGLEGKDLREAISDFKDKRYQAYVNNFTDTVTKELEKGGERTAEDKLAERYWSADAPEDIYGNPDFDAQRATRDAVLREAAAAGVDLNYIISTDGTGYLNKKYADPTVAQTIAKLETDRRAIETSGYWDMRDKLWTEMNATAPVPGYTEGMGYYEWKDAQTKELEQRLIAAGMPKLLAKAEAVERLDNKTDNPIIAGFIQAFEGVGAKPGLYKERALYPWVQANPQEFLKLVEWGYMENPDTKLEEDLARILAGQ